MNGFEIPGGSAADVPSPAAAGDLIKDTTTTTFMADVVEASRDALVLVDFWAPWCGPCKQLTPVLEKVVQAAGGAVRLAKMDIDQNPEVPGQMGVQSIPAVFAFKDGRPVDGFAGVRPESEIKKFIEKHAGPDAFTGGTGGIDAANAALDAGDLQGAADQFSAMLAADRENVDAIAGLARVCVASGDLDQAATLLAGVPVDKANSAAVSAAQAVLDLARQAASAGETAPLLAKVEATPDDHAARLELAIALSAANDRDGAVDHLLEIIARQSGWNDDAARKQLVQFFEAWGPTDPAAIAGRKRLSILLFS